MAYMVCDDIYIIVYIYGYFHIYLTISLSTIYPLTSCKAVQPPRPETPGPVRSATGLPGVGGDGWRCQWLGFHSWLSLKAGVS